VGRYLRSGILRTCGSIAKNDGLAFRRSSPRHSPIFFFLTIDLTNAANTRREPVYVCDPVEYMLRNSDEDETYAFVRKDERRVLDIIFESELRAVLEPEELDTRHDPESPERADFFSGVEYLPK
jgi:hypothetical protein